MEGLSWDISELELDFDREALLDAQLDVGNEIDTEKDDEIFLKQRGSSLNSAAKSFIDAKKKQDDSNKTKLKAIATALIAYKKSKRDSRFYDVQVPITAHGLLLNIAPVNGVASFTSYRKLPSGEPGPAEQQDLMECRGDKIVQVNGEECEGKSFKEVIGMLGKASEDKREFCHLRMQSIRS